MIIDQDPAQNMTFEQEVAFFQDQIAPESVSDIRLMMMALVALLDPSLSPPDDSRSDRVALIQELYQRGTGRSLPRRERNVNVKPNPPYPFIKP